MSALGRWRFLPGSKELAKFAFLGGSLEESQASRRLVDVLLAIQLENINVLLADLATPTLSRPEQAS